MIKLNVTRRCNADYCVQIIQLYIYHGVVYSSETWPVKMKDTQRLERNQGRR